MLSGPHDVKARGARSIPPEAKLRCRAMTATAIKPRRRWTDEAIEIELREQRAQLGHFPTRAELVADGLRSLWDAMRAAGGVEMWRARFSNGHSASHDEIATRAYELYERGAPGDSVAHWLAAEEELS
jgi:hypothetical protein